MASRKTVDVLVMRNPRDRPLHERIALTATAVLTAVVMFVPIILIFGSKIDYEHVAISGFVGLFGYLLVRRARRASGW